MYAGLLKPRGKESTLCFLRCDGLLREGGLLEARTMGSGRDDEWVGADAFKSCV